MSHRVRIVLISTALTLTAFAWPQIAGAASFKASIRGTQNLTWKVDGTEGNCDIRHGVGGGTMSFKFASAKSEPIYVGGSRKNLKISGSLNTTAKGSINGAFSFQTVTPCPGFSPDHPEPYVYSATGCGDRNFGIRTDLTTKGAFTYVTGARSFGTPGSIAIASGDCPFPLDVPVLESNDFSACGDGRDLWKRSWGIASSGGEGLLASRFAISIKRLLRMKKRKSKAITGRARVSCTMPSQFSGGVTYDGELKYTITVRRTH